MLDFPGGDQQPKCRSVAARAAITADWTSAAGDASTRPIIIRDAIRAPRRVATLDREANHMRHLDATKPSP